MKAALFALTLALAAALPAVFAQQSGNITFKSTELASGLYMLEGVGGFAGGNLGLSVGEDGVILIDDSMPPLTNNMKAAIAALTDQKVDFVINTHIHGDHTGGNVAMTQAGATIVAHDNIRRRMLEEGVSTGAGTVKAPKGALPVLTFSDAITFHLNGHEARVFHAKNAHTDGDAIIHFPGADVIHTGDIFFNGMFPFIDLNSGGSVEGFIAAQEEILSLAGEKTKIIPGHGPLAQKSDLQTAVNMLKDCNKKVTALVAQGKSEEEVIASNPLAEYHDKWNWAFITTERMTRTLYRDAKK